MDRAFGFLVLSRGSGELLIIFPEGCMEVIGEKISFPFEEDEPVDAF